MGWTAYYQILRDRPLDDDELVTLRDFVTRTNTPPFDSEAFGLKVTRAARPDRLLGRGYTKLPFSMDESDDHNRLCAALTALPHVLAGVEVRITDDFGTFGVDNGVVSMTAVSGPLPVEVAEADRESFQVPEAYVGEAAVLLAADVIATMRALEGDAPPEPEAIRAALIALARLDHAHPDAPALARALARVPSTRLASMGLADYAEVRHGEAARALVVAAVHAVATEGPVDELVQPFLKMWDEAQGIYWYGDMAWTNASRAALTRHPEIEAQMIADLDAALAGASKELVHRRAEAAAKMLGLAGTTTAMRAIVAGLRATRGGELSSDLRYHTRAGLAHAVAALRVDATVPTLLLEASGPYHRSQQLALEALLSLAPARAAPIGRALVAGGAGDVLLELLAAAGDEASIDTLRAACASPAQRIAERAAAVLTARGLDAPPIAPPPAAEELVTHADGSIRRDALRALDERDDPSLLTSFLAAFELDVAIRRPYDNGYGGYQLRDRLPTKVRRSSLDEQLAWVRDQAELPPQVIWPSVQALVDGGAAAVATAAAAYPRPWRELDDATRAALVAEETALLAALDDGRPDRLAAIADAAAAGPPVTLAPVDYPAAPRPVVFTPQPAPAIAPRAPAATRVEPLPLPPDPVAAPPPPVEPDAELTATIDALLGALGDERPSPAVLARTGLPAAVRTMSRWDRARAIRDRLVALGAVAAATRLLDRLRELHEQSDLREICDAVLPIAAVDPAFAARLGRVWDEIFSTPWASPYVAGALLQAVAPALFPRAVEELAAPCDDDPLRHRTSAALEVIGAQRDRRNQAVEVLIARLRADRGLPRDRVGWRRDAYRALVRTGAADAIPTAILELAERATGDHGTALLELLATDARGFAVLATAIELPGYAVDAARELCRSRWSNEGTRQTYLAHPFWKLRLAAADACRDWDRARAERYSIWKAIDAAGLPDVERDRASARPYDAAPETTWDELLRPLGGPVEVAPLPPLADGMASACSDLRAWSLRAVDLRAAPEDAVARVFADELDRAMVDRGHRRNGPRWSRWRAVAAALDDGRTARLAWARAHADAPLPPLLARVRDEGAAAVAAALPSPALGVTADERVALESGERAVADRGDALLQQGVETQPMPQVAPPRPASSGDSYF